MTTTLSDFFATMHVELNLILLLVLLLIFKLSSDNLSNTFVSGVVEVFLLVGIVSTFLITQNGILFNGMYNSNELIRFEKAILLFGTFIISLQSRSWLKNHSHASEFYMLLIGCLLGMFYMISSLNVLMFWIGLELATIPLAALANFDLQKKKSSESAMKLILSSAFSSGILLFGISLFYGTTGSLDFHSIAASINGSPLQVFAFILVFAGFAFKISLVPFHLWTADVYEGAPVSVTAFLSVISKGSVVFAFVSALYFVFNSMSTLWYEMLVFTSLLTMTIGNLFAMRQNNMKRFLAFSSITQAGYILLGISGSSQIGMASAIYFILIYVFSNLGAFGVVAIISTAKGKEHIDDYKGLYKSNATLALVLAICLFSLAGIPPTAGFFGKMFLIFAGASKASYWVLIVASLNMIVSLYYYLRVVRAMFVDANESKMEKISLSAPEKIAMALCTIGVLALGFYGKIFEHIASISFGL